MLNVTGLHRRDFGMACVRTIASSVPRHNRATERRLYWSAVTGQAAAGDNKDDVWRLGTSLAAGSGVDYGFTLGC